MTKKPELIEVKSSNVAAMGYEDGVMTVKYKNNRTYSYYDVPEELFHEVLNSETVGKALAEKIKGTYPTQKDIEDADPKDDKGATPETKDLGTSATADEGTNVEPGEAFGPAPAVDGDDADSADSETTGQDGEPEASDGGDAETEPEPEVNDANQPPNKSQSKNLELIRNELQKFEIDLQYERVEDKAGNFFWNLSASVEKADRTLHHGCQIVENCTKDEAEAAIEGIVKEFVTAP